MLKIYLVERCLKHLIEIPDFELDFTVRQLLYTVVKDKLGIKDNYLHYGLWVHNEKSLSRESDMSGQLTEMVELNNINRTVEDVLSEWGIGASFVLRKRIFTLKFMQEIEK